MKISELCYELYKLDWKKTHNVTPEREARELMRGYSEILRDDDETSVSEYISDYGYGGELYVCYEEFLEAEYEDDDYVKYLLQGNEMLYDEYLEDIEKEG